MAVATARSSSRARRRLPPVGGEHWEQAKFFAAIRASAHPAAALTFAIPNGLMTSPAARRQGAREGVKRGVWDVQCTVPRPPHPTLWIEFKFGDGELSPEQVVFGEAMHALGHKMVVAYSAEEALTAWCHYLGLSYAARPTPPAITPGKTASRNRGSA